QRGHAPGDRGQGRGGDPEREPDPGHDHAAELLPALRQARRHDRYGHDRGQRVPPDLQARRGADPHQQADDPDRPSRCRLPDGGTDIMLGGNPEFIADLELHQRGLSPVDTPEDYEAAWPEAVEKSKRAVAAEHEEVVDLGGLYVLGTERHESRRIDNQLRGRSGRQGDAGETRFYLSGTDDLVRLFAGDRITGIMERFKLAEDQPMAHKLLSRQIESAQKKGE